MNKIEFMRQFDGVNRVDVIYKSGVSRSVGLGDRYYRFSKTQRDFMDNATVFDMPNGTRLWVDENTDTRVTDFICRNGGIERR